MDTTTSSGMTISILDRDDLKTRIRSREWWVVAFGQNHTGYIDDLDIALGVEPTYQTLVSPVMATWIPKAEVSVAQLNKALAKIGAPQSVPEDGSLDIVLIGDSPEDAMQLGAALDRMLA